jgi:hypothetical protein
VLSTPTEAHYWHLGPYNFFLDEKNVNKAYSRKKLEYSRKNLNIQIAGLWLIPTFFKALPTFYLLFCIVPAF